MYAAIRLDRGTTRTAEELVRAGRTLSAALGQVPGFISWILLDAADHALISVSISEDPAGLEHACLLLGAWLAGQQILPVDQQPEIITGEVILQKGL